MLPDHVLGAFSFADPVLGICLGNVWTEKNQFASAGMGLQKIAVSVYIWKNKNPSQVQIK